MRETGRVDVAVCLHVDPSTALAPEVATVALQASVNALVQQGYSALGSRPVVACPQAPVFLRTNTVHPKNSGGGTGGSAALVTTASPYLLFVAVTTPARIGTIFGALTTRRGAEESMCTGNNCAEVTGSIYLDPTAFDRPVERENAILEGLGLVAVR